MCSLLSFYISFYLVINKSKKIINRKDKGERQSQPSESLVSNRTIKFLLQVDDFLNQ